MSDACVLCDHNVPRAKATAATVGATSGISVNGAGLDDGVMCTDIPTCVDRAIQRAIRGTTAKTPWQRAFNHHLAGRLRAGA